jgi:hypothetical protein
MTDFENPYIRERRSSRRIDDLATTSEPGSAVQETMKVAIQAKMVERMAAPSGGPQCRSSLPLSVRARPVCPPS